LKKSYHIEKKRERDNIVFHKARLSFIEIQIDFVLDEEEKI